MKVISRACCTLVALGLALTIGADGCGRPPPGGPIGVSAGPPRTTAVDVTLDNLPSWRSGPTKDAIVTFVRRVTLRGSPDFVPEPERIAAFDNDGTLWQEKPLAQLAFVFERVRVLAATDPSLASKQPFKAALEHDTTYFETEGARALLPLVVQTQGGMSEAAYDANVRAFFAEARHPKFGVPYTALTYRPMLELLAYLKANAFTIYVCSGGDTQFMRVVAPGLYGLGPERIIGSTMKRTSRQDNGTIVIQREQELTSMNDKLEKPISLDARMGRRPVFAVGNVGNGGDVAMLEFSRGKKGSSFQMLIFHDDAEREFAYGADDAASLSAARDEAFALVSMKRDWAKIFDFPVHH